jgi:hypothetical protein
MSKQPKAWVESMLVAYVDGQLDPAQTAAVENIVREDPEARSIVDALRRSAAAVKTAFDQPLHEAVPERLLAALGGTGPGSTEAKVVPIRRFSRSMATIRPVTALAASVAMLFVGIGIGYSQFAPDKGIRLAGMESSAFEISLYRALEGDDPGVGIRYGDAANDRSGAITVIGNVETRLGDACREFRHEWQDARGKGMEIGLACRAPNGEWSVLTVPQGPAS